VKEFGLNPAILAGFTSDGASVMVAAGRELKVLHQTCLGICCAFQRKEIPESRLRYVTNYDKAIIPLI
jgi:hypothetical protein